MKVSTTYGPALVRGGMSMWGIALSVVTAVVSRGDAMPTCVSPRLMSGCVNDSPIEIDSFTTPFFEVVDPGCPNSPHYPSVSGTGIVGVRSVQTIDTCAQPVVPITQMSTVPGEGAAQVWLGSYAFVSSTQAVILSYRDFGSICLGTVGELVVVGSGSTSITATQCCEGEAVVTATVGSAGGSSSLTRRVNGGGGEIKFPVREFTGTADFTAISSIDIQFAIGPAADCGTCNANSPCCSIASSWTVDRIIALSPPDVDGDLVADTMDNCPAFPNPSQADCNHDGIGDACDIGAGAPDLNHNGIPDSCECVGDIFADGRIDGGDLGVLLANWGVVNGSTGSQLSDLDASGLVDGSDLGILLYGWGACD
jgi:hypothetical protein